MSGLLIEKNRSFQILRWSVALMVICITAAYAYFGVRWYNTGELSPLPLPVSAADTSIDETPVTEEQISLHRVPAEQPRYIEIAKLGIQKARINRVGLTNRNLLDVPKNINDAAWYVKSATPGNGYGAVLMNGHSSGVGSDGIFAHLASLRKGDQVAIERGDGKSYTYEVNDVRDVSLDWVNKEGMKEMMQSVDPSKEGLNLITYSGKWVPRQKVFDRRILVRATIVE